MKRWPGPVAILLAATFVGGGGCVTVVRPGVSPSVPPAGTPTVGPTAAPTAPPIDTPTAPPTPGPTRTPRPARTATPAPLRELSLDAPPVGGTLDMGAGFLLDPYPTDLRSGGDVDASYLGGDCAGDTGPARSLAVDYSAGGAGLLRFYFLGPGNATLIMRGPDGRWHCNDDSYGTADPAIDFAQPASGRYDIWIGAHGRARQGTLFVTEIEANHPGAPATPGVLDPGLAPGFGTIDVRFNQPPYVQTKHMTASGSVNVTYVGSGCRGYTTAAPSVAIQYTVVGIQANWTLRFRFKATGDTTLVVYTAEGEWLCNDDSGGAIDPMVDVDDPIPGRYVTWVGTYASDASISGIWSIEQFP